MKIRLILGVFLILFMASCLKDESEVGFHGIVIDYNTNEPIPEALVKLVQYRELDPVSPDFFIDSISKLTWTNGDGRYSIYSNPDGRRYHEVFVEKEGYLKYVDNDFKVGNETNFSAMNDDTIMLGKECLLKVNISNVEDKYDSVWLRFDSFRPVDTTEIYQLNVEYSPRSYRLYPAPKDTTVLYKYLYYQDKPYVNIHWDILDKPSENEYTVQVESIPQDTVYFSIEY